MKFSTRHGRFPRGRAEFADEVVDHVARQVKVSATELGLYEWTGRTIEYHRAQIHDHLGFRVCGVVDAEKLTQWLAAEVAHAERHPDRVREELLRHCRQERIEPPTPDRVTRIVRSALHVAEENWFAVIAALLEEQVHGRVLGLVDFSPDDDAPDAGHAAQEYGSSPGADEEPDGESVLALIKAMPGNISLESMLRGMDKLTAIRAIGLPGDLFADVAPKVLASWRARAAVESPSHLRRRARNSPAAAVTLLAALLVEREREVTDALVDLLIATVHRIGARADVFRKRWFLEA
ncbi:DUF4158 domain-containing protein [Spirillospora sp. CA-255316]